MIIWLASYPKSGNTWVRSFLSALLYDDNGEANLSILKNIKQFPTRDQFNNIVKDFQSINEVSKKWCIAQNNINLDGKIKFFKTHHVNCNFDNNQFTNLNNTIGVIHIVRDPRNVITSIKNHFSSKNIYEAKDFLLNENNCIGLIKEKNKKIKGNKIITLISSWKTNYTSWKDVSNNYLLIKYENLISNPILEFNKITKYVEKICNLNFKRNKIEKAIQTSSFSNLQKQEEHGLFSENAEIINEDKKIKFFHLGPNNNWKKLLDRNISKEIEKKYSKEMIELGYL